MTVLRELWAIFKQRHPDTRMVPNDVTNSGRESMRVENRNAAEDEFSNPDALNFSNEDRGALF